MDDIRIPHKKPVKKMILPTEASLYAASQERLRAAVEFESLNQSEPAAQLATNPSPNQDTAPRPVYGSYSEPPKKRRKRWSKRKRIWVIVAIIVTLALAAAIYVFVINKPSDATNQPQQAQSTPEPEPVKAPEPILSPLTGRTLTDAALAKRPVTGIMIENSLEARPQSGLYQADMVYEAIAEGGVTRFMAVYQESMPNYIGPVRSARPYYLDYILGLDGSFGHVGGSPEALQDIKTLGVKDLDQFANGSSYQRVSSKYAPHNVYTDFTKLDALNQKKGYTSSTFTPFARKIDVPQTPTATQINFTLSGQRYNPSFTYSAESNSYLRSQAGGAHTDEKTKSQINPKVVIALVTNKSYDPDGYHTEYTTSGNGKLYVFQDGIVSEGTWSKTDRKASLQLKDTYGLPMKLNAGQTWITLVASANDVRYSTP